MWKGCVQVCQCPAPEGDNSPIIRLAREAKSYDSSRVAAVTTGDANVPVRQRVAKFGNWNRLR
jgi:hypothetical protein